ncbi:hypothetical protein GGX14DRAFT_619159 [Mycena pura]|uniref:Uncharacterized protein n=1 Tax=Mycena pura TaxID=153505 RepID=A0AAD6YIZ5_9AGAR|nr:hypothetical protein GGX14DRAFT_619159 [Mycena pura]
MPKRKTLDEDSDIEDLMEEVGLTPEVLATLKTHPKSTKIVADIVNRLGIKDSALTRARLELPSFLNITWSQVASRFALSRSFSWLNFVIDPIPGVTLCYLPPSFHRELYMRSWSAMNVYAEPTEHISEVPRVRLLDIARLVSLFSIPWSPGLNLSQYLVPIFALFAGRIEDFPEHAMPESEFLSGGSVEHKIFIVGNILFLVIELKACFDNMERNVAHLFAELYSASKMNGDVGFESLTVYGLLTDLGTFQFYSFNPISKTFYRNSKIVVHRNFVLQACLDTLEATCTKSEERSSSGSLSPTGSSPLQQLQNAPSNPTPITKGRSLEAWPKAHQHALAAQNKLKQFSGNLTALEESAAEGLKFLELSVGCVSRTTQITSKRDIPSKADLETMAQKAVERWHVNLFWATPNSIHLEVITKVHLPHRRGSHGEPTTGDTALFLPLPMLPSSKNGNELKEEPVAAVARREPFKGPCKALLIENMNSGACEIIRQ